MIHRDVKPGNIIVRSDGHAVLTDFGLARETGREGVTVTGELTGTPAYQSPEQVGLASTALGPLSDVFSLGVTLFELLTGEKPFNGDSVLAIHQHIVRSQPTDPSKLNPRITRDLVLVLRKAMQKRPGDRYASAGAMAEDLRRFGVNEAVQARPLPLPVRLKRWCAQNPLPAAFLGLLLLGSALVAFSWWRAESALSDFRWLAAGVRVEALRQAHDRAPPAWPQHESQYRDWVAEADVLCGWLPLFRQQLRRLRAAGIANDDGSLQFAQTEQQFLYDGNARNLDGLLDVEQRVLPDLRQQLEWAQKIERLTIDQHRDAWRQVTDAVAADPRFDGFALRPQLGLVPLRRDADSGLWEFAHLRSGALPQTDANNRWVIDGDTGIVLVLVPPLEFWMGCQKDDPDGPNYDPKARAFDGPVHRVAIEQPFFLSKYELSRGQWQRLGGQLAISDAVDTEDQQDLNRYPLMGQSYSEVAHRLHRFGLDLPTESQWEACCRAGSQDPWACGRDVAQLVKMANIRDLDLSDQRDTVNPPRSPVYAQHADGFAKQAPVAWADYRPNAFGFCQMHGNVDELCRDWLIRGYDNAGPPRPQDGLRPGRSSARVVRGGNYLRDVFKTASGIRNGVPPGARQRSIGVRPSRAVIP